MTWCGVIESMDCERGVRDGCVEGGERESEGQGGRDRERLQVAHPIITHTLTLSVIRRFGEQPLEVKQLPFSINLSLIPSNFTCTPSLSW